jgi:hypothetical protein
MIWKADPLLLSWEQRVNSLTEPLRDLRHVFVDMLEDTGKIQQQDYNVTFNFSYDQHTMELSILVSS